MIVAMDLNASPVPEEDEETFDRHIEQYSAPGPEERIETAVDIARRVSFLVSFLFGMPPARGSLICLSFCCRLVVSIGIYEVLKVVWYSGLSHIVSIKCFVQNNVLMQN